MNIDGTFSGVAMAAAAVPTKPEIAARNQELIEAVKQVNQSGKLGDRNMLVFEMDAATRRPVMQIVDRETNEVISQIPPEAVVRLARRLRFLV
jgi:uncharacterized FlaG/YvyC family protein